jgi:hypothetical protein
MRPSEDDNERDFKRMSTSTTSHRCSRDCSKLGKRKIDPTGIARAVSRDSSVPRAKDRTVPPPSSLGPPVKYLRLARPRLLTCCQPAMPWKYFQALLMKALLNSNATPPRCSRRTGKPAPGYSTKFVKILILHHGYSVL